MTEAEIRDTFRYHRPDPGKLAAFELVRELMVETVAEIAAILPPSRERSTFITDMQRAQMMANASIAIHGVSEGPR